MIGSFASSGLSLQRAAVAQYSGGHRPTVVDVSMTKMLTKGIIMQGDRDGHHHDRSPECGEDVVAESFGSKYIASLYQR